MKNVFTAIVIIAALCCACTGALAAELLDVKPVVSGSAVSVEISADVAMTYTFYKVPGQARAVVDIAEADPEKVEPLIVVNKGAVSSISVDKAQISGIVVSRIIFNLVSESDISVTAAPDRKLLTVTFSGLATPGKSEPKPEPMPEPKPEPELKPAQAPEPVAITELPATAATAAASPSAAPAKEDDPLGLDEPVAKSEAKPSKTTTAAVATVATVATAVVAVSGTTLQTSPTVTRVPKLEPVVPATTPNGRPSALAIKDVAIGASYIEIRTNQSALKYKATRLTAPDRLFIDIASESTNQRPKVVAINKFGISKVRIGVSPKNIRVVLDSDKVGFPAHTITNSEDGVRINFK